MRIFTLPICHIECPDVYRDVSKWANQQLVGLSTSNKLEMRNDIKKNIPWDVNHAQIIVEAEYLLAAKATEVAKQVDVIS
jgi:hypothetical protein